MALFKKIAELRKNKRIRKTIAVVTSGVTLRFASMNFDSLAPVPDVSNKSPSIIVFSDQELDSLDDPNSEVTLVKAGDSTPSAPTSGQPSNFPTGGRPGRPVYVNPYRVAPKLLDQELGAGNNPAGAGGNGAADFDPNLNDQCPASQQG